MDGTSPGIEQRLQPLAQEDRESVGAWCRPAASRLARKACGSSGLRAFEQDRQPASPKDFSVLPYAYFDSRQAREQDSCARQMSGSDCRPQGNRLPEPNRNVFILTTPFSQFSLSPALMKRIEANNFEIPTPVQIGCIPPALEGRDVLATAQTGTGKTLGVLIPIIDMLPKAVGRGPDAHALILLPTRELAMQVEQAFLAIRSSSEQTVA